MATARRDQLAVLAGSVLAWVLSVASIWLGVVVAEKNALFDQWTAWKACDFAGRHGAGRLHRLARAIFFAG